jgi:excinuclease ABC subunit A
MQKPDVDEIAGLSPAISIDQKSASRNPRSTVATITEIYDYLRIVYARIGQPYCLDVDVPIQKLSQDEILSMVLQSIEQKEVKTAQKNEKVMGIEVSKGRVSIFSPVVVGRKGEYYQLLYDLLGKGYETVKIDGEIKQLRDKITLTKTKRHDIDVLVDEIYVSEFTDDPKGSKERLSEAVELALESKVQMGVTAHCPPSLFVQLMVRHFQKLNHDYFRLTHRTVRVLNVMDWVWLVFFKAMNVRSAVVPDCAQKQCVCT